MSKKQELVAKIAHDYTVAWNSKSAEAVASFYAEDGQISINRGEPWVGRSRIAEMAAGFYADVPDLSLTCDDIRLSGSHAIYVWTFTGHDVNTKNPFEDQRLGRVGIARGPEGSDIPRVVRCG